MNRREFFKVIGTVAAATALPVAGMTKLLSNEKPTPPELAVLGVIRKSVAYDISTDLMLVRFDVLTDDVQLSVDARCYEEDAESEMPKLREMAKELFEKELRKRGKSWADLRPWPESRWQENS